MARPKKTIKLDVNMTIAVTTKQREEYQIASRYRIAQWVRDTLDAEIKRLGEKK